MRLKHFIYLLMMLPLWGGCNNEDDIHDIFSSGTWYVVNYFTKANWDKRNGEPKYKPTDKEGRNALEIIGKFTLNFNNDGTFAGAIQNSNIEGTWEADGKSRTVRLVVKGTPNTSSAYNREFIETLQSAAFYQGDSKYLMLGKDDKKSYIQFRHN